MQNSETNKNYQNGIPLYNLKVGDMISTDHGFGLITKITGRKYYYKVLYGRDKSTAQHAVSREDFWQMAEDGQSFNNLIVHYSPDMRYRRKRKIEMQEQKL